MLRKARKEASLKKSLKSKKGVSDVVVTIILVVVAFAVAAIAATFITSEINKAKTASVDEEGNITYPAP